MASPELEAAWAILEALLREALSLEQHQIDPQEAHLISEFVEHREYGLAYEFLTGALDEAGAVPSTHGAALLKEASRLMRREA